MDSFSHFINSLLSNIKINYNNQLAIEQVRNAISKINEYFYTIKPDIGSTKVMEQNFEYFSEFHKFWEGHHEEILDPQIVEDKCYKIAEIFNNLVNKYGIQIFYDLYDTNNLSSEEICKIRYFSANQDFRDSLNFSRLIDIYQTDPTIFDKETINNSPEDFLRNLGLTSLSQSDKRVKYAKTSSQILIDNNIEPFDLFKHYNNDVLEIKNFLLNRQGTGFGNKKVDMFIRDMVVLNVWKEPKNFDKINVASDINTVKVALRTGILKTSIPLVSSFIDIFCYQYNLIDDINAKAWRRVWEIWKESHPDTCIKSPSLLDYLIYNLIGKKFCKESLFIFECETMEHTFRWHSGRNKTCQICRDRKANVIKKVLPCQDKEGYLAIEKIDKVSGQNAIFKDVKECFFASVCLPQSPDFIKLNPPKSISILGQTGWESARVKKSEGGGGLMA